MNTYERLTGADMTKGLKNRDFVSTRINALREA